MSTMGIVSIVRDPVHEYISLYADELSVVDSQAFQRLRHVKQNATAFLTYPSCIGSRFEHSLGTKHLAERMFLSAIQKSDPKIVEEFLLAAARELRLANDNSEATLRRLTRLIRLAALTHDLGHPPFSHTLEELMEWAVEQVLEPADLPGWVDYRAASHGRLHEYIGTLLLERSKDVRAAVGEDLEHVTALLRTPSGQATIPSTLHEMISFDVDADRCDYLVRDGKTSGADFGNIDVDRLVESMRLHKVTFGPEGETTRFVVRPTIKALSAIEALLVERYKAYRWLYFHPKVVATNAILREACLRHYQAVLDERAPLAQIGFDLRYGYPVADRDDGMLSSSFDDVYVWSVLRQAHLVCRSAMESRELGDWTEAELLELKTLLEELLFRHKSGFSLWKNVKTYEDFDKTIRAEVGEIWYEDQRRRHRALYGSELPEAELKRIEPDEFALNWVSKTCLASFGDRQGLQQRVNQRLRDAGGFVVIGASFFKALEYGAEAGEYTLIGSNGRLYRVTDVSELLHHLQRARQRDVLLHVYALWPGENPVSWDEQTREEKREFVVGAVRQATLGWLSEYLEAGR